MKPLRIAALMALGLALNIANAQVPPAGATRAAAVATERPDSGVAASAGASPMASIPFRQDQGLGAMALEVGFGLTIAIGAAIVVLYLLRRHLSSTQGAAGRRLRVIETVRLSPRTALFLVELDGRSLLLGQQGEHLAVLDAPRPENPGVQVDHDA